MTKMTSLSIRSVCEAHARDFLTDEVWRAWKNDYDQMMAYRKSLKGKPTEDQLFTIRTNADWISFYDQVLWHAPYIGVAKCVCAACSKKRQATKTP